MDKDGRFGLYRRAIETWGVSAQVAVAGEELSELYRALSRMETPERYSSDNLAEEMADSIIVCEQLTVIYEIGDLVELQLAGYNSNGAGVGPVQFRRSVAGLMALLCDYFDRGRVDTRELQRLLVEVLYCIYYYRERWDLSGLVEREMDVKAGQSP